MDDYDDNICSKTENNPEMMLIYIMPTLFPSRVEYLRMNLYEKQEITDEEIKKIREEINVKYAKQRAIRMLAARDRTEYEVKTRLIRLGFDDISAESAVLQLKAMGYINDMLFARKYISDRLKLKPKSKKALAYELEKKGIEADIIADVMDEFEVDEFLIAYRLAKRKYGKYDATDPKIQRRIASFLSHKGFSYDIIKSTLEQIIEAHNK